jgi:hypothetical protein
VAVAAATGYRPDVVLLAADDAGFDPPFVAGETSSTTAASAARRLTA